MITCIKICGSQDKEVNSCALLLVYTRLHVWHHSQIDWTMSNQLYSNLYEVSLDNHLVLFWLMIIHTTLHALHGWLMGMITLYASNKGIHIQLYSQVCLNNFLEYNHAAKLILECLAILLNVSIYFNDLCKNYRLTTRLF